MTDLNLSSPVLIKGSINPNDAAKYRALLFNDKNYGGFTGTVGIGNTRLPYPLAGDIESLIVPALTRVTLFENGDCTGRRQEFTEGKHPTAGGGGQLKTECVRVSPLVKVNDGVPGATAQVLDRGHHELASTCAGPALASIDVPPGRQVLVQKCGKTYEMKAGSYHDAREAFSPGRICLDVQEVAVEQGGVDVNGCPYSKPTKPTVYTGTFFGGRQFSFDEGKFPLTDPALKSFNASLVVPDGYRVTLLTRPDCTGYGAHYDPGCKSSISGDLFTQAQCMMVDRLDGAPLPVSGGGGFPGTANYVSTLKSSGASMAQSLADGQSGAGLRAKRVEAEEQAEGEEACGLAEAAGEGEEAEEGGDSAYVYVEDDAEELATAAADGPLAPADCPDDLPVA